MEKLLEEALLFDFYGEMLTDHQKQIYQDFVMGDLSLGEIAADRGISRQGVHDIIKRSRRLMQDCESKLHLVEKFIHIKERASEINRQAEEILAREAGPGFVRDRLLRIRALSDQIVEEL